MMTEQKKCAEIVAGAMAGRLADIRDMWDRWHDADATDDERDEAFDELNNYGLSFDYVAPNTFENQPRGYWRWQISWGGPSDEFRFYGEVINDYSVSLDAVEYWRMDWFDGAYARPSGDDLALLKEWFDDIAETGTAVHVRNQSLAD